MKSSIRNLFFLIITVSFYFTSTHAYEFPPQFRYAQNQEAYFRSLMEAFSNVLTQTTSPPPADPHPRDRLMNALKAQLEARTQAEPHPYIDALNGKDPMTEILLILRQYKIANLETFITALSQGKPNVPISRKLTPRQTAAVLVFYLALDTQQGTSESQVLRGQMLTTTNTRIANGLRQITQWPSVPLRIHDADQPKAHYDANAWKSAAQEFLKLGLYDEFLLIRSQLVNFEASQLTTRHIADFDKKFFQHLRIVALHYHGKDKRLPPNPQLAKKVLLAYLANTHSEAASRRRAEREERKPSKQAQAPRSLWEFAEAFSKLKRVQLIKFFEDGSLPKRLQKVKSELIHDLREYLGTQSFRFENDLPTSPLPALKAACAKAAGG